MQVPITSEVWNEDKTKCLLELDIKGDLPFFKGHFPSQPVVPGAFQLQWVLEHCQRLGLSRSQLTKVKKVKFKGLILPDKKVMLELVTNNTGKISFKFFSDDEVYSLGSLTP